MTGVSPVGPSPRSGARRADSDTTALPPNASDAARSDGECRVVDELVDLGGERTRVHEHCDLGQAAPHVPRAPSPVVDRRVPTPVRTLSPSRTTLDHTETLPPPPPYSPTQRPRAPSPYRRLARSSPEQSSPVRSTEERPPIRAQTCNYVAWPAAHAPGGDPGTDPGTWPGASRAASRRPVRTSCRPTVAMGAGPGRSGNRRVRTGVMATGTIDRARTENVNGSGAVSGICDTGRDRSRDQLRDRVAR